MDFSKRRRISVKFKSANPLFEKWLEEWKEEARLNGWKSHQTFNKALQYLRKCPIPLNSGRECLILKGFGEKLCKMLDQKLQDHQNVEKDVHLSNYSNIQNSNNTPQSVADSDEVKEVAGIEEVNENRLSSSSENLAEYIPMPTTGEYVILLALYRKHIQLNYLGYATKQEIISEAQQFSDISLNKNIRGTKFTAWNARKMLISKNFLTEKGKPLKYSLTDSGVSLAKKLYDEIYPNNDDINAVGDKLLRTQNILKDDGMSDDIIILDDLPLTNESNIPAIPISSEDIFRSAQNSTEVLPRQKTITKHPSTSSTTSVQSQSQEECIIFPPGSFDVILYVDTAETTGNHAKSKSDAFLTELGKSLAVDSFEVKHLSVGDYIWICRERSTKKELVLPYIVERKRLDDFAGSIKDGRYHEQKFRLKRSGVSNKIYLIERWGGTPVGLPLPTLMQAATNTAVQDGFVVKVTADLKHTAAYLSNFTDLLASQFKDKTVMSCSKDNLGDIDLTDDLIHLMTFREFNQSSMKNKPMKVTDLFVKMLLQIKGISVDRALAIVEIYPTPAVLRQAYMENAGVKGEKLLAPIKFGKFKKAIGPILSKTIYQLFTFESF